MVNSVVLVKENGVKILSWSLSAAVVAVLSACSSGQMVSDKVAAGAGAPDGIQAATSVAVSTIVKLDGRGGSIEALAGEARYAVSKVDISVPATLVVSEANLFYPTADIVWRAEPVGDRYAQVKSVLEEGFASGVKGMTSGPAARLEITLERFHALTEKARFSVGGVHDVIFSLTVRDAKTGEVLEGPRRIEVAIRASGSDKAIAEDVAGKTQRVVIVAGLAEAIRRELAIVPVGLAPKRKGLFAGLSLQGGTE